jgi:hypothetical protein
MERAMLWFKCAAMHDPVRPVAKKPATIGWEAKQRQVDLVIERSFRGDELLSRMKGWVTADVGRVTEIIRQHGKLKILDDYDLVVETPDKADQKALSQKLSEAFGEEVWLEPIAKSLLS